MPASSSSSVLGWLAAGALGVLIYRLATGRSIDTTSHTDAMASFSAKLQAGVPYLMEVVLTVSDDEARAELASKGVEMLVFANVAGRRVASFKVTPQGNGEVTLGQNFYGIGTLGKVSRLDGRPFEEGSV